MADEQIKLALERLAYGGDAVGHSEGKVVFAAYGLPGEQVSVALTEQRKNFARGRVVNVLADPSPNRVTPRCEYFGECGGCQWQHLDYSAQAATKADLLAEQLRRIGGIEIKPQPTLNAPDPWAYRNVARLQVRYPLEGSKPVLGYYRRESHGIVPIERCYIVHPRIVEMLAPLHLLLDTLPRDSLSAVTIRASFSDNTTYLLLHQGNVRVNTSDVRRAVSRWVKFQQIVEHFDLRGIATVARLALQSRRPSPKGNTDTSEYTDIGGESGELVYDPSSAEALWGDGDFSEVVGKTRYSFPPAAFFQVNSSAAYTLAEAVRQAVGEAPAPTTKRASARSGRTLLDLYSGVGLFSLHLLAAGAVGGAVGIEAQNEAVRAARVNAEAQGLTSACEFYTGRVEEVLPELLAEGLAAPIMVADPPRAGLSPAVIELIIAANPQRLVYVSCDPSTLARDIKALSAHYRLISTQVVDLFPQTYHIESISVLERMDDAPQS